MPKDIPQVGPLLWGVDHYCLSNKKLLRWSPQLAVSSFSVRTAILIECSRRQAVRLDHRRRLRRVQEIDQRLGCLGVLGDGHDCRRKDKGLLKFNRQRTDELDAGDRHKYLELGHTDLGCTVCNQDPNIFRGLARTVFAFISLAIPRRSIWSATWMPLSLPNAGSI